MCQLQEIRQEGLSLRAIFQAEGHIQTASSELAAHCERSHGCHQLQAVAVPEDGLARFMRQEAQGFPGGWECPLQVPTVRHTPCQVALSQIFHAVLTSPEAVTLYCQPHSRFADKIPKGHPTATSNH